MNVARNTSFCESLRKRSATPAGDLPRRAVFTGHRSRQSFATRTGCTPFSRASQSSTFNQSKR